MYTTLLNLPVEILITIFKYLDIRDLYNLKLTCSHIKDVINSSLHLLLKSDHLANCQVGYAFKHR